MVRKIVKIAVFLFIANALYQFAPVAIRHVQFKEALQEMALGGHKASDAELVNGALALARENNIPLEPEYVGVRHEIGALHIDASYVEPLLLFPRYRYKWRFDIDAKALDLTGGGARR